MESRLIPSLRDSSCTLESTIVGKICRIKTTLPGNLTIQIMTDKNLIRKHPFKTRWEAENKNYDKEAEGVIRNDQKQLIVNFIILRGFVDVCFFIFNYKGKGYV